MTDNKSGFDSVSEIATKLFDLMLQSPFIAMIAIAFAFISIALPIVLSKTSPVARIIGYGFLGLCLIIIGSGWLLIIFPQNKDLNSATLSVRLNDSDVKESHRGKASSKAHADGALVYHRRGQNDPNVATWSHEVLVRGRPEKLFFSIFGRRTIECRTPDFDEFESPLDGTTTASGVGVANTFFEVDLSRAYKPGIDFDIDFEYQDNLLQEPGDTRKISDRLFLTRAEGIDVNELKVFASHTESLTCRQDRIPNRYFEVRLNDPSRTAENSIFTFIRSAFAGNVDYQQQKTFVETLSKDGSPSNDGRLNSYLSANPEESEVISAEILSDPNVSLETKLGYLETLLTLSASDRPKTEVFLNELVPLITNDNFDIRRSAARILRAPEYTDETVVAAVQNYIDQNKDTLALKQVSGRDYSALYLATAAGRDVYYNYGIRQIDEIYASADDISAEELATRTGRAIETFEAGQVLSSYATDDRRVLFGKLDYGVALANYTAAGVAWAQTQKLDDPNLENNASKVDAVISEARENGISFTDEAGYVLEARNSFKDFLHKVEPNSTNYAWPHHLKQAQQCLSSPDESLASNCLRLNSDE